MANLTERDKKIKRLAGELGECLKNNSYKEAWGLAGKLSSEMKGDSETGLTMDEILNIQNLIKSYYSLNTQYNNVAKKMYGLGSKLLEVSS